MKERSPGSERLGSYDLTAVGGEQVRAFIPPPLPPYPALDMGNLFVLFEEASTALGRLDSLALIVPDTALFLYMYVRKEALLSSQIEGTQSSLSDLLLFENEEMPGVPVNDVQEVSNYVAAMRHGLEQLKTLPVSVRVLKEIHAVLMAKGRGQTQDPGEFRRSQNWIGGTRPGNAVFVPPPPHLVPQCMSELEKFIHADNTGLPVLIKAALVHVQFETIHPFLDGNGRLGRLLITFMLCASGLLREPALYLSLFLKSNRQRYYELLQRVREHGDWEAWLEFFLTGVRETANQAASTATRIMTMMLGHRRQLEALGRPAASALRVHEYLLAHPITSVAAATKALHMTAPTARKSINHLVDLGMLKEISGKKRNKLYLYDEYLKILNEGTEPLKN